MIIRIDTRYIVLRMRSVIGCLLLLATMTLSLRAQVTGDASAPPPRVSTGRPQLIGVEFEGNDETDLNDKVLKAQIKSKGTEKPTVRRIFSIFANVYDANPFMPQRMRDEMHAIVD